MPQSSVCPPRHCTNAWLIIGFLSTLDVLPSKGVIGSYGGATARWVQDCRTGQRPSRFSSVSRPLYFKDNRYWHITAAKSRLLALPLEVRCRIYSYYHPFLSGRTDHRLSSVEEFFGGNLGIMITANQINIPEHHGMALMQVCRQVHTEMCQLCRHPRYIVRLSGPRCYSPIWSVRANAKPLETFHTTYSFMYDPKIFRTRPQCIRFELLPPSSIEINYVRLGSEDHFRWCQELDEQGGRSNEDPLSSDFCSWCCKPYRASPIPGIQFCDWRLDSLFRSSLQNYIEDFPPKRSSVCGRCSKLVKEMTYGTLRKPATVQIDTQRVCPCGGRCSQEPCPVIYKVFVKLVFLNFIKAMAEYIYEEVAPDTYCPTIELVLPKRGELEKVAKEARSSFYQSFRYYANFCDTRYFSWGQSCKILEEGNYQVIRITTSGRPMIRDKCLDIIEVISSQICLITPEEWAAYHYRMDGWPHRDYSWRGQKWELVSVPYPAGLLISDIANSGVIAVLAMEPGVGRIARLEILSVIQHHPHAYRWHSETEVKARKLNSKIYAIRSESSHMHWKAQRNHL